MTYNFDEVIDRRGSGCVKYDKVEQGLIPLWVADMDFATPPFIIEAIRRRLDCPVLGYPVVPEEYFPTVASWVGRVHGWAVRPEQMCFIPGIVKGIGFAECALLSPGDKVIVQQPVYHPFRIVSSKNGMEVLYNNLIEVRENGVLTGYRMDFENLEECIRQGAKMLVLANPQNPSGQCWDRETLVRLAEITSRSGVIVISDEIHAEMAHTGFRHIPYASVSPEAAANSITFMAPSKTFNIAGVVTSYAIVPDPELRRKFFSWVDANEVDYPPIFSIEATMAAYREGWEWRGQMLRYVEGNIDYVCDFIDSNIPGIHALRPQASFLVWLDCRGLGLSQRELVEFFEKGAGLYLNDGSIFGGEGFMRLNVGCPRSILETAIARLAAAAKAARAAKAAGADLSKAEI